MRNLIAILMCIAASNTAAQAVAGRWEGVMHRGVSSLPFIIGVADSTRGTFTAGDIGAMDVPLTNLRLSPGIHWELVGDQSTTTFDGTLLGDSISGSFSEPGHPGTFWLHRTSSSVEPSYTTTEVRFGDGDALLGGSVLSPKSPGRHAAVVFLQGSGAEGRWANAFTADYLARNEIVVLIYDKRGVGVSTGDWKTSTMEDLAADGRAGVELLARRSDVDPRRIGIFGHSQGGFIAPMVASNRNVAWIIDADGNVGPLYEQDLFRVNTMLAKMFRGDTLRRAKTLYHEFVDVARNHLAHAQLRADLAGYNNPDVTDALGIPDDSSWVWSWYGKVGNDDNRAAWASVRVPVLLLYGGRDEVVPQQTSIDTIRRILVEHGNRAVTVRVLAGADHTLRLPPADADGWPRYAPGYPDLVRAWIERR